MKQIWYTWSGDGVHPEKVVDVLYRSGYTHSELWNGNISFNESLMYQFNRGWVDYSTDVVAYTLGETKED